METRQEMKEKRRFTYEDYLTWDDDNRYELIDGEVFDMAPAPSPTHQSISMELSGQFRNSLIGKLCKVFAAPFDVRLQRSKRNDTVVQPDLLVICDPSKIDKRGCKGAPDLVIEITSPFSATHDCIRKFNVYQDAGVREYWIVDPYRKIVTVSTLENNRYVSTEYDNKSKIHVSVLEDCEIDLSTVYPDIVEDE